MGTSTRLSVAATAALLAACATPYKPESAFNGGGFSEQRRATGVYQVWFVGNEYTSEDRSDELALLRGAELCLAERKPFMRASNFQTGSVLRGVSPGFSIMRSMPVVPTSDNQNGQPVPRIIGYVPGRALYTTRSGLKVECLAEGGENAQDAAAVAASLRERYRLARASTR